MRRLQANDSNVHHANPHPRRLARPQLQALLRLSDAAPHSPSYDGGNGHALPDWRVAVSTVALLATLLAPPDVRASSVHGPGDAQQGPPSKEDLMVLQGACELALHAMGGYVALAASGDGAWLVW